MPSTIDSTRPFRPLRWLFFILILMGVVLLVGYNMGFDAATTPRTPPASVTARMPGVAPTP